MRNSNPRHVVEYEWYSGPGDLIAKLAGGSAIGSDSPDPSEVDVAGLVAPLRYRLDDDAINRYRMVGADTMAAVDAACAALTPAMTETEAAGAVTAALFLQKFVPEGTNWVHIDTYAWRPAAKPGRPKGGDVLGIRAMWHVLKARFGKPGSPA